MKKIILSFVTLFVYISSQAQHFDLIPLGIYGGEQEDNLSAYLVGAPKDTAFLCLDAGTINTGIRKSHSAEKSLWNRRDDTTQSNKRVFYFSWSFRSSIRSDYQFSGR